MISSNLFFLINQGLQIFCIALVGFFCGKIVNRYEIKVNYTRKVLHFSMVLIPILLVELFPYEKKMITFLCSSIINILFILLFINPIRRKSKILQIIYKSFDRPEDRPYTVIWLTTQTVATYLVIAIIFYFYQRLNIIPLIYIIVFSVTIGDGLAEPIGIRFGRHSFSTIAIFSKRSYTRSLEGSLCVFIVSAVSIVFFSNLFTSQQFIIALLLFPLIMTVTEAKSPHTWDSPFLFLSGGTTLFFIQTLG